MKVVLFCGGLGTRLREYTGEIPKPMVKIGYRPILWHLMKYYAHFGHTDFVLCLGYKADVIKEFFLHYEEWISNDFTLSKGGRELTLENNDIEDWNITFVDTGLHANIGERLVAVRKYVEDEEMFLANYSDGLTDLDLNVMLVRVPTERPGRHLPGRAALAELPPRRPRRRRGGRGATAGQRDRSAHQRRLLRLPAGGLRLHRAWRGARARSRSLASSQERKLHGHRYDRFWCMDTFKEQQQLTDLYNSGRAPWEVWKNDAYEAPAP